MTTSPVFDGSAADGSADYDASTDGTTIRATSAARVLIQSISSWSLSLHRPGFPATVSGMSNIPVSKILTGGVLAGVVLCALDYLVQNYVLATDWQNTRT